MNKKYSKFGKNLLLLILGNTGSKLLTFFLVPLYTYTLSQAQYGISDLIFTLCSLGLPVFTLYTYSGMMRFALDTDASHSQLFSNTAFFNNIGFISIALCSSIMLLFEDMAPYYIFFLLYFLMHEWNTTLLYFARGINKVGDYTVATIINTAMTVLFNIVFLLFFKMGVEGYLLAYIIAMFVSSVYLALRIKIKDYILPLRKLDRNIAKDMLRYSVPLIPNMLSWWISNYSDKFLIIYFSGIELSGLYAISYKIPSIVNVISTIFISAWQISSVDDFGSEESKKFYSDIYQKYSTILMIGTSVIILLSKFLGGILFQQKFYEAWHYVPILSFAVMFHALSVFFGSVYTAAKKTKSVAYSVIIGAIINIVLNIILILNYGAYGAAIATLVSYIVVFLIRVFHSKTIFSFHIPYLNDILCFAVLFIQVLIMSLNIPYMYLWNSLCVIALIGLKFKHIIWFIKNGIDFILKFIKK